MLPSSSFDLYYSDNSQASPRYPTTTTSGIINRSRISKSKSSFSIRASELDTEFSSSNSGSGGAAAAASLSAPAIITRYSTRHNSLKGDGFGLEPPSLGNTNSCRGTTLDSVAKKTPERHCAEYHHTRYHDNSNGTARVLLKPSGKQQMTTPSSRRASQDLAHYPGKNPHPCTGTHLKALTRKSISSRHLPAACSQPKAAAHSVTSGAQSRRSSTGTLYHSSETEIWPAPMSSSYRNLTHSSRSAAGRRRSVEEGRSATTTTPTARQHRHSSKRSSTSPTGSRSFDDRADQTADESILFCSRSSELPNLIGINVTYSRASSGRDEAVRTPRASLENGRLFHSSQQRIDHHACSPRDSNQSMRRVIMGGPSPQSLPASTTTEHTTAATTGCDSSIVTGYTNNEESKRSLAAVLDERLSLAPPSIRPSRRSLDMTTLSCKNLQLLGPGQQPSASGNSGHGGGASDEPTDSATDNPHRRPRRSVSFAPSSVVTTSSSFDFFAKDDPRQKAALFEKIMENTYDISGSKFEMLSKRLAEKERMKEERSAERALVEEANSALSRAMQLQKAAEDEKEKKAKMSAGKQSRFSHILMKAAKYARGGESKRTQSADAAADTPPSTSPAVAATSAVQQSSSSWSKMWKQLSKDEVLLERRLEAVYVSFARFNKWEGEKMVVTQKCEGLACNRFVQLCQSAGLVNDTMTVRAVTTIFNTNTDSKATSLTGALMSFPQFICALATLAEEQNRKRRDAFDAVLRLNAENRICVHSA